MKILYDYQAFDMQRFGGVSNCFVQLIKRLPPCFEYEIAIKESNNVHLCDSGLVHIEKCRLMENNFISKKNFKGRSFLYRQFSRLFPLHTSTGINRQCSIDALQKGDFDVFHPTFFDDYFIPHLHGKPYVLTVHDMIPELFWSWDKKDKQILNKPKLCSEATHIIAVSERTKQDLIDLFHLPEKKITVIHHGAPETIAMREEKPIVSDDYVLYVGRRRLYKYFDEMLLSMVDVFVHHPQLKMVCTGTPFSKPELDLIHSIGLEERIMLLHPNDHEMMNLYANALCFIYPSIYEGFGIPILEAYKARCPVLLNNKSCFPEIAQDAAVYFHLDESQSDLADVMEQFLNMTNEERRVIIEKQNERLKVFSWQSSARKLADVYEECVN